MEYSGMLLTDGNCIKSPMKRMFIFPNSSMFDFSFYSFRYRVVSIVKPIMDTSSMMRYSTRSHLGIMEFTIEASMEVSTCSPTKECRKDSPVMIEAHAI